MNLLYVGIGLFVVCVCWFLFILKHDPRTLLSGFSLLCVFLVALLCLGMQYLELSDNDAASALYTYFIFILLIIVILDIVIFPFIFFLVYFIQGVQVIRKEGFRFQNTLSLLVALGILFYIFFYPNLRTLHNSIWFRTLHSVLSISIIYISFVFVIFAFTSIINLVHINSNKKHFDYIIVLGCGIFGEKITPLLAGRVNKGLELLKKHPKAKIIFSGGQGNGEDISEAECMYRYALDKGIDSSRMIKEDKSMDTHENLINSYKIIDDPNASIVLVTTRFHVLRSLIIAKQLHIKCIGYGSKTKLYFALNAQLREFVGYLSISKWKHITLLSLFILLEVGYAILSFMH